MKESCYRKKLKQRQNHRQCKKECKLYAKKEKNRKTDALK
jgi:hypothetical protein